MKKITHINNDNKPQMVDVSKKKITSRSAHAQSSVIFPLEIIDRFVNGDIATANGASICHSSYRWSYGGKKNL